MNKKTKSSIILTSLGAIALAGSLMAGATYALFTSESKTNIAVTSGKVDVKATIENLKTYSGVDLTGDPETDASKIVETATNGEFTNGGKATIDGENLKLENMTPGDKVTFDIKVTNNSNVKIKYRTCVSSSNDTGLFSGLNVSIGDEKFYGFTVKSSLKDLSEAGVAETIHVEVSLPSDAENTYQDKACEMKFAVEAYQSNAKVEEAASNELELYSVEDLFGFARAANSKAFGKDQPLNAYNSVKLMNDIDLNGKAWTPINFSYAEGAIGSFTIDGNGHSISNMDIECAGYGGFIRSTSHVDLTIKNLAFKEANIETTNNFNGVAIGHAYGNITLDNVDVADSSILCIGETKIIRNGGLIGLVPEDSGAFTFKDCDVTNSTISGYHNVGAMVGSLMTKETVTITNCTASDNKLIYGSETVGAFNFGASTSGYTEYVPSEGFTATSNTIIREIAPGLTYYNEKYHITSANGLTKMKELVEDAIQYDNDGVWVLEEDLDLKDVIWSPINDFYGEFDGNGKTISNLTVSANGSSAGLFGKNTLNSESGAATPTIHDLTFTNANVTGTLSQGVGVVAGWINFGDVTNVTVKESAVEGEKYVAGIVGVGNGAGNTDISNCKVIDSTIKNVEGTTKGKVGGIAGFIVPGSVLNCSVTGSTIIGYECVGGIIGRAGTGDGAVQVKDNSVSDNNVSIFSSSKETTVGSIIGQALNVTSDSQTNS